MQIKLRGSVAHFQLIRFNPETHFELVDQVTTLLHQSYKPLADKGLRYVATYQDSDVTLRRLKKGASFFGFLDDELVSTITIIHDDPSDTCSWYKNPEVFYFSQFAVKPVYQGHGLGSMILSFAEEYARTHGALELALDTSEKAEDLINLYLKKGYREVDKANWDSTNYKSVIMSKKLDSNFSSEVIGSQEL